MIPGVIAPKVEDPLGAGKAVAFTDDVAAAVFFSSALSSPSSPSLSLFCSVISMSSQTPTWPDPLVGAKLKLGPTLICTISP